MNLPAYPKYKRSYIDWLPSVPDQWDVKRSDGIVSADRAQVAPEVFVGREVFHYSIPVVQEKGSGQIENGDGLASAKQVVSKSVVLVSKLNPRKATICIAQPQPDVLTLCSTEFVALNADRCELRFLEYLVRSELFRQLLDSKIQSVTRSHQRAKPDDIYKFWNAWPSRDEQRAIADFLDRETARLDTLVGKKRALIGKLKEKRTALISRTVIRGLPLAAAKAAGLNPHPKLKPSRIAWLGDVPEEWEVVPLGYLARRMGGATPNKAKSEYWDGDIPWVSPKDMKRPRISDAEDHVSIEALQNSPLPMIPPGAVLIVVRGMILAHSFPIALTGAPLTINQDMKALVAGRRVNPEFLFWSLSGFARAFVSLADESAHGTRKIETSILKRFPFLLPSPSEQQEIADYLDRETAKLDRMMEKVEAAIEKLQEYRTALITAAVTGKIDVRKAGQNRSDPPPLTD